MNVGAYTRATSSPLPGGAAACQQHVEVFVHSESVRVGETRCWAANPNQAVERCCVADSLLVILSGCVKLLTRSGTHRGDPYTALLIPRQGDFASRHAGERVVRSRWLQFEEGLLDDALDGAWSAGRHSGQTLTLSLHAREYLALAACTRAARAGFDEAAVTESAVACVRRLLGRSATSALETPAGRTPDRCRLADQVCEVLALEFANRITLSHLAAGLDVSRGHICRVFRRATGRSLHTYLTGLRLRAAAERIFAGERNLSHLALACGFSSHSHMTSAFRREFQLSPSEWRRELRDPRRLKAYWPPR